jgi:hypothetical protein
MDQKKIIALFVLLLISCGGYSQKLIKGFVIDSASFAPLAYVNIKVKNTSRGTSTDEKGGFTLPTLKGDSLVFSLVGYNSEEFSGLELEETVIIRMAIRVKELAAITIIGRKEKTVRPIHMVPKSNMANYGPYGAGINLAYFGKLEKEKRKLHKVQAEYQRVKNYVAVVCSPEVRERICEEYSLTDDQYYQLLAKFNMTNKDARYDLTAEEWITVLRNFCSANVIKR